MVDCRHCLWAKTSNYRTVRVLHLRGISSHIWARTWNLAYTEYTHKLSMLEAGGCDLSKGFLLWPLCETVWRAVEGLASLRLLSEKARNTCFPVAQQLASPPASIFLTSLLLLQRIPSRSWLFDPALLCSTAISIYQGYLYVILCHVDFFLSLKSGFITFFASSCLMSQI